jgi:hypothetical protein
MRAVELAVFQEGYWRNIAIALIDRWQPILNECNRLRRLTKRSSCSGKSIGILNQIANRYTRMRIGEDFSCQLARLS